MPTIYRGTTPTITCTVTDDEGNTLDLTGYTLYFSIGKAKNPQLTVTNGQMSVTSSAAAVTLTQEQTLALKKGDTYMQLRGVDGDVAIATEMDPLTVADIIYEEEIEDVTD